MQRKIGISLGVLAVILALFQGVAVQKQTTIPGIFFPSATPTRTYTPTVTPTNTLTNTPTASTTPTKTKTPTITVTVTPDPRMIECASLLEDYFLLRSTVQPILDTAFDTTKLKTTVDYSHAYHRILSFTEKYEKQYDARLLACLPRTSTLHDKDVDLLYAAGRVDLYTSGLMFSAVQRAAADFAIVLTERSTIFRKLSTDYVELQRKYPSVDWPKLEP